MFKPLQNLSEITAVILAGGRGTRLRSIVSDKPKVLAKILGRPFLTFLLDQLESASISNVVLCTGYMSEEIHKKIGTVYKSLRIVYSREKAPLGTGGALRNALNKTNSNRFLVLNGDSYCQLDLSNFLKTHQARKAKASLYLVKVEDCSRYGSVKINGNGKVQAFLEKSNRGREGLISAGIYILERSIVEKIPEGKMFSLEKEVFPNLIGKKLYGVISEGPFIDIGTPESYIKAENILRNEI